MRKRTLKFAFDKIFWYLIYLMPLLFYVLYSLFQVYYDKGLLDFSVFMSMIGCGIFQDNLVLTSLTSIFGADGIMPVFITTGILHYLTYFVYMVIIHLFIDFILFIPRIAHKFMNKFTGDEDE